MPPLLLTVLSVSLHTLALPPWALAATAWFALAPFFVALRDLSPARAALLGLLWGSAAAWGFGYWVPAALTGYYGQSASFGILFAIAASVLFCGSYYAAFAALAAWLKPWQSGNAGAALIAALWVSCELARARLLTGDPWLLFGYAALPYSTLVQVADLGGVYALSFLLVLVNAALAIAVTQRSYRPLMAAAAALLAVLAYGSLRLATPLPEEGGLPVLVVQGNNDLGAQWRDEMYGAGLRPYLRLTLEAGRERASRLVVWPESAVTFFVAHEPAYRSAIARVLRRIGADLILGAPHYADADPARPLYYNSAFYLGADGEVHSRYDKVHLLPFAEYFPLRTIDLLHRRFERVRSFVPGKALHTLDTAHGRVATVICFEAIFPHLVRSAMAEDAAFLVNLTNDAWLSSRAGREQHLAMVTLRAVENRTWVVRATTTGISAVIDPFGRTVAQGEDNVATILRADIVPRREATFYTRQGDLCAGLCLGVSTCAVVLRLTASRRRQARSTR